MKNEIVKAFITMRKLFRQWLLKSLQPCKKMVPLMSESMDRSLNLSEWLQLRLHLIVCAWCASYLKQIRFLRQILHEDVMTANPFAVLDTKARERLTRSIRKNQ